MNKEEFAKALKACRKAAGLTQTEVSKLTLVPVPTLKKWELGEREAPAYVQRWLIKDINDTISN